jgi:UDP-N-acetylmuramate--alanine ligase
MYNIDFNNPKHVHFIGIGGISMSGLAHILIGRHFTVTGSDSKESELTDELIREGAKIAFSQTAANITDDIDVVVYTAAISDSNEELAAAKEKGLPLLTRAQLLGQLMTNYRVAVNIAGTHGKTTTTSMLTQILLEADCDPTVSVGGMLSSIGGNVRVGKSDIFVTEACEYTNSFLSFNPTMDVILNVKADHLDFFSGIEDIRHSFKLFTERLPHHGKLIINSDIDDFSYFYKDSDCEVITVGSEYDRSVYSAEDIDFDEDGCCSYTLRVNNAAVIRSDFSDDTADGAHIILSVPGLHNVHNSLAAIAAARNLGVSIGVIAAALKHFGGTDRRFQRKGSFNGVTVIDDYAHHPDEIAATLAATAHFKHKRVWCTFQPHTYSRTKALLNEFADALSAADAVVLADIYAAREKDTHEISSKDLARKLTERGVECHYFPTFAEIEDFLRKNCGEGDLLLTMGAGNIYQVGDDLVSQPS